MQTDLSDGVRYLAKEGIADSSRVCIMGGSYGGYAALAGVSLDPGVYRCAVSIAGVSDPKRLLQQADYRGTGSRTLRYWDRFMGVTGPGDPVLDQISPIKHLDAVNVPMLLIHGVDDTVVPFKQSSLVFEAMTGERKRVQLVTLKHGRPLALAQRDTPADAAGFGRVSARKQSAGLARLAAFHRSGSDA
jgi:dipeptidyl aminopeptidase/acylaminoacyl peptidase